MAVKDLALRLTPIFASAQADKAIAHQQKALRATQTTMERLNKDATTGLRVQESLWRKLGASVTTFGRSTVSAMDSALSGVNRFQRGIEGAIGKVANLRNVVMGSAIGFGAYRLGSAVLGQGAGQVRTFRALDREFGKGALRDSLLAASKDISKGAGIQDDDAIAGLLPIARAIRETKVGDRVGGRSIRTRAQLEAVQQAQMKAAAAKFRILAATNPNMGAEQIGFLLAEAGQGDAGLRGLASALHLGRGSMKDLLADAKKSKMGTGDIVNEMFRRSGHTDKAADEEMRSFEGQVRALGATINGALGDVGATVIERFNARLGSGATLAERMANAIEKNRPAINAAADGIARMAEGAITLAEKAPAAFRWLDDHKTAIAAFAASYGVLRGAGALRTTFASSGVGSLVDKVAGTSLGVQRVFVTNWPGGGTPGGGGNEGGNSVVKWGRRLFGGFAGAPLATAALGAGFVAANAELEARVTRITDKYNADNPVDADASRYFGTGYARAHKAVMRRGGMQIGNFGSLAEQLEADRKASIDGLIASGRSSVGWSGNPDDPKNAFTPRSMQAGQGGPTGQPNVNINIGNIATGVGQSPAAIVQGLLPHIEEQLTRGLMAKVPARAGGE